MSLRRRLTLLTTAILLVSTAIIGTVAYLSAASIQYASIDRNLRAAAAVERIKGLVDNPRPVPADVYSTVGVILIDAAGQSRTLRPAGYGGDPLPLPKLDAATLSAAQEGLVTVGYDPAFRAIATSRNGGGDTIVALTPLVEVQDQLSRLGRGIILAVLAVTGGGAVLAWFLIRRALRPVGAMVAAAQGIADGDVERRVPTAAPGTEMGDLAVALNAMIASLASSLAEVRASEQKLRTFVSDASHDLRTPITVIRGYSELLGREGEPRNDLDRRALARIGEESQRLDRLLTQLLTLQRIANSADGSRATCDVAEVFSSVFGDFAALHTDRDVLIDVESALVSGSTETWTQVAGNLAQNIDRYSPAGSPVWVRLHVRETLCEITVDDSGPGIPIGQREEMLERFTRLEESRGTETGGSGLGLSIVRTAVEAHGGRVRLDESPTGGVRVVIATPLVIAR